MTRTKTFCYECGHAVPNNRDGTAGYHPHLHCVIFKAYHENPAKVLSDYGYTRERREDTDT